MDKPPTLKLLAVADYVEPQLYHNSVKSHLPKIDLLVSCGDLPPYYLDFLVTNLDAPLIHVIGNHCCATHDIQGRCLPSEYPGAYNLHARLSTIQTGDSTPPLLVAGLEGSPLYNNGPHQYTESYVAFNLLRLVPGLLLNKARHGRYLDLLVTHTPPRGIHDNPDIAHRGFTSLLPFIQRFKPALLLHGHTHRYDPTLPIRSTYMQTEIINAYGHVTVDLTLQGSLQGQANADKSNLEGRWVIINKSALPLAHELRSKSVKNGGENGTRGRVPGSDQGDVSA